MGGIGWSRFILTTTSTNCIGSASGTTENYSSTTKAYGFKGLGLRLFLAGMEFETGLSWGELIVHH